VFYLKADSVSGRGVIDVSGGRGENSVFGFGGFVNKEKLLSFGGDNDDRGLDWCRACARERGLVEKDCEDGSNPGAAEIETIVSGFNSGCGGGGAGGSGGYSLIEFHNGNGISSGFNFNLSPGTGGNACSVDNYNPAFSGANGTTGAKRECNLTKNSCL
jgi:hypothetical protein